MKHEISDSERPTASNGVMGNTTENGVVGNEK
jgi:hypothetical protein